MPLIDGKSLLQLTLERVSLLSSSVICVASEDHRFLVSEAMQAAKVPGTVLLEPMARNTAAAFAQVVQRGLATAKEGAIVTFGISPTFPSTAYGYIRQGSQPELKTPQVTPQVAQLIAVIQGELTRQELMVTLDLKDRKHFANAYLKPALAAGQIKMTLPDKPNSRLQKYRLTQVGEVQ